MDEEEKKHPFLILPDAMEDPVVPLTSLSKDELDEFRNHVLRRCTGSQLKAGLREATDSYTFVRGDDIDGDLADAYEQEIKEREGWGWGPNSVGSGRTMDRKQLKKFALFIRRHSQYIFSRNSDGSDNLRYS